MLRAGGLPARWISAMIWPYAFGRTCTHPGFETGNALSGGSRTVPEPYVQLSQDGGGQ